MPALRYRDLSAAINWLCRAFGFEGHDVVTAVDGTILRARLKFGRETILLLPVRNSGPPVSRPAEEIGHEMQSYYFIVDDPDEHYLHAKDAGAEVIEIMEYDDGGRGYSCRDPEGHIWNFVTYDSSLTPATPDDTPELTPDEPVDASNSRLGNAVSLRGRVTRPAIFATVVGTVIVAAIVGLWLVTSPQLLPKASALLGHAKGGAEDTGSHVPRRKHVDRLPVNKMAGARRTEQASEATARPPPESTSLYSPALSTIGTPKRDDGDERTTRPTNEPAPKAVAEEFPQEAPRVQAATAEPPQAPDEVRAKRKSVARAMPGVREPPLKAAQPAQEQKGDSQLWDCQPTPTGMVVCKPRGKKPAAAETTAPTASKSKITTAPPSNAPSPRPPRARTADSQAWDCKPKPPTGEVGCRPIGAAP